MKRTKILSFAIVLVIQLTLSACTKGTTQGVVLTSSSHSGQIYLYGEEHGVAKIYDKEFEIWHDYYQNKSMRHLFVELSYYTAELLNLWMHSDNNTILDEIYTDWSGTPSHNPDIKKFLKRIKSQCPETIFHGTDVGHQYDTTGTRYLKYLEENKLESTEHYRLAKEAIEQGKTFYKSNADVYRENEMAKNFIREYDKLGSESIMGIYGAAHTGLAALDFTHKVPCMANQLKQHYDTIIHSEDLSWLAKDIDPSRVDTIVVEGKEYKASYFGKQDINWHKDYTSREFWRLEDAYDNFKNKSKTGNVLPYDNYPMLIETGQVFVIDYTKKDSSVVREYFRSDGKVWEGLPSTEGFTVK